MLKFRIAALTGFALVVIGAVWHGNTIAQEGSSAGIITVFDHQKLEASFAKATANGGSDVVWTHTSSEGTYNVATHSRDSAAVACKPEGCSHKDFTAVVYVVSGTATLVIGGNAKTATNSFGGHPIQGGESYRVSKGDIYLVPPDTPHWYKDVEAPFHYIEIPVH